MAPVPFPSTLSSPEHEGGGRLTSFLINVSRVQNTDLENGVPAKIKQMLYAFPWR